MWVVKVFKKFCAYMDLLSREEAKLWLHGHLHRQCLRRRKACTAADFTSWAGQNRCSRCKIASRVTGLFKISSNTLACWTVRSYAVTATMGVFRFTLLVDFIMRAAASPSTRARSDHLLGLTLNLLIGIRISIRIISNGTSPMAHRMACAPLRTMTGRHWSISKIVSRILQLIGLSSATRQVSCFGSGFRGDGKQSAVRAQYRG